MAGFTEKQKQTAIQNIETYFRDRGNTLIHPVVLDDDGNEIRGAENIFNVLSEGKRVRIPGEGNAVPDILRMNKNGRLHTLDAKAQADLVRRVDDRYRNIRQNEMPKGIDQDGNLIVSATAIEEVLVKGGTVRIPGEGNEPGALYTVDPQSTEEISKQVTEQYNAPVLAAGPVGIDEDGNPVEGAEKIAEALTQGKTIRIADRYDVGAYHTMQLGEAGGIDMSWIMPEVGIKINEENQNVQKPERPEYMDRPDEPEDLTQTVAAMVPAELRSYAENTWNEDSKAVDEFGEPLNSTDAILDALSKEDPVFVPEENGLYRRMVYRDGHLWESVEPVKVGEYLSSDEMRRVAISRSPQQDFLKKNGFTNARDLEGNVYTDQVAILEQLEKPGAKLYLYNDTHSILSVARNEDGMVQATAPKATADTEPLFFDRYPGLLPEDGDKILTFNKSEIERAVDEKGKKYGSADQILTALYGTDKHLRIYKTGETVPYDVVKKNNRFYVTKNLGDVKEEPFNSIGEVEPPEADPVKSFLKREWTFDGHLTPEEQKHEEQLKKAQGPAYVDTRIHFAFALDENGRMYRDLDEVSAYLRENGHKPLFIYDKDGGLPYAVEYKDGRMLKSDGPVCSRNRMRSSDAYEPKKSLDVDDIVHRADYSKVSQAKDLVSDWKKRKTFFENNIKEIEKVKKNGKPNPPARPKKPSLGFLNSIAYGFVWLFTAGRGDTEAHREYRERLENYPSMLNYYNTTTLPEYNSKKKAWDEYVENGETRLAEYKEGLKRATEKYAEVSAAYGEAKNVYNAELKGNDVWDVSTYRSKLEVELEGVADLQKEGRITRNNIFAHTWLKEAECEGKKASDPEARKALCAFIAGKAVEDQILNDRVSGELVNVGVENRRVEDLNSGRAYDALEKDADLNAMLDQMGDAPLRPHQIYSAFTERLATRQIQSKGYKTVYTDVMKAMNFTFGKKKIDESCVDDLIRLQRMQNYYEHDKGYALPYDEETAKKQYTSARENVRLVNRKPITEKEREPILKAVQALKAENREPMGLDEMLTAVNAKKKELADQAEAESQGPQMSKS